MNAIMHYLPHILIYILGIMGIYSAANAVNRFVKYNEIPLIDLLIYPTSDEVNEMTFKQAIISCIKDLAKLVVFIGMTPVTAMSSYFVVLDSILWLNRELGLGLTFLSGLYGPNMEILR